MFTDYKQIYLKNFTIEECVYLKKMITGHRQKMTTGS